MGKCSTCVDGKVLDFVYKRNKNEHLKFQYKFYLGDIFMGQVSNMGKSWSAVPGTPRKFGLVHGFKNRYYACEYILKSKGVWAE